MQDVSERIRFKALKLSLSGYFVEIFFWTHVL